MQTIEMPAFISQVPLVDSFDLDPNSIIIEDEGVEYLIGKDALLQSSDGGRQAGGSLADPHYRRLLKALIARLLGEGEHSSSVAFSAAHHMIERFRAAPRSLELSNHSNEMLRELVGTIKFKTERSDSFL